MGRGYSSRPTPAHTFPYPEWVACLDLEGKKRPVVVVWGKFFYHLMGDKSSPSECALLDGRNGKLLWHNNFPGWARPDLLYRPPDGRLALVFQVPPKGQGLQAKGGVLVPVAASGEEVHQTPFAAEQDGEGLPLPDGFERRSLVSLPFTKDRESGLGAPGGDRLWRFEDWSCWNSRSYYTHEDARQARRL
jgi:hypothetical protein